MCGRFTLATPGEMLAEAFGLDEAPHAAPRYNVAPTQPVLAIRHDPAARARRAALLRWGLLHRPGGVVRRPLINARSETAAETFREAFRKRRCLVPADGFYEWKAMPGDKARQPLHFRMRDGRPFALAGLWSPVSKAGETTSGSCVILTTEPNDAIAAVHDRMPLILPREAYDVWLDPAVQTPEALDPLLVPFPALEMTCQAVGPTVNDPRNETADCLRPL